MKKKSKKNGPHVGKKTKRPKKILLSRLPPLSLNFLFRSLSSSLSHHTHTPTERERERERERECGGAFGATLKMDTPVKNQLATTSKFEVFPINPTLSIVFLFVILIIIVLFFFCKIKLFCLVTEKLN